LPAPTPITCWLVRVRTPPRPARSCPRFPVRSLPVGSPVPHSRNLTVKDVSDLTIIDASAHPSPDMHTETVADALAAHHPTLVIFATPAYCQSRTCAPELEVVRKLEPTYQGKVDFIHIEIWQDPLKTYMPAVREWHLPSEPWIFIIGRDGKISAKFEGPTTRDEIDAALAAWTRYQDSLSLFRNAGDEPSISVALNNLANIAKEQGDTAESITLYEQSLAIKRRLGDSRGVAITLNNLGTLALVQGAYDRAVNLGEEALTLLRALGDKDVTAAIDTVARAALNHGDTRRAAVLYDEGLKVSYAAGDRELIAFCLEGMLYGAGEALRIAVGAPLSPSEVPQHEASLREARVSLGEEMFTCAWDRGLRMDLEAAISVAREPARPV